MPTLKKKPKATPKKVAKKVKRSYAPAGGSTRKPVKQAATTFEAANRRLPTGAQRPNQRAAQAQDAAQQKLRAQNLLSGVNLKDSQKTTKTYIGADGKDTRQFDSNGNPIAGTGVLSDIKVKAPLAPNTPGGAAAMQNLEDVGNQTVTGPRIGSQVPQSTKPSIPKPATTGSPARDAAAARDRQLGQSREDLFALTRKPEKQKLDEFGISAPRQSLYDLLFKTPGVSIGAFDGRSAIRGASEDLLKQLQAMGVVESSAPISSREGGGFNVMLNVGEDQFKEEFDFFKRIRNGDDVKEALDAAGQLERDAAGQVIPEDGTKEDVPPGTSPYAPPGSGSGSGAPQQDDQTRTDAVNGLMQAGITDPAQILDYLNYDESGQQIGDFTLPEVQRRMSQGQQPMLPGYGSDPLAFIESFGTASQALMAQGLSRQETMERLDREDEDSRFMYLQGIESAKERRERQLEFSDDLTDLQRSREVSAHEKERSIQMTDQKRAEAIAREQAEEDESVSRRAAARLGITTDSGGVQWMRDVVRKSNEYLSYIVERGGIEAAGMVRDHENNMKAIDYDAQFRYDAAWDTYDAAISTVSKDRNLDKKAIREAREKADQAYIDKLWEVDKWKSEQRLTEIRRAEDKTWEMYKLDRQEKIDAAKNKVQTAKERIDFARDTYSLITNSVAYKEYDEVRTRSIYARETFQQYQDGYVDRSVMANALTKSFEKILDPTSVVREGEFAMTENLQTYFTASGWTGLKQKLAGGGTAVPDEVFADLVNLSEAFTRVQLKRVQEQSAPLLEQASQYNQFLDEPITKDMLIPGGLPTGDYDTWGSWASEYYSGGAPGDVTIPGGENIAGAPVPTFDYKATDNLPPVNSRVSTTVASGIITGYGSAASAPGLDLAGDFGAPVRAPMGGTIVEITYDPSWKGNPFADDKAFTAAKTAKSPQYNAQRAQNGGYGNSVVMKLDDGRTIRLSHLSGTIDPKMKGQRVEYGSELGKIGNTGMTYGRTGVHVDIEMTDVGGRKFSAKEVAAYIGAGSATPGKYVASKGGGSAPAPAPKPTGLQLGSGAPGRTGTTLAPGKNPTLSPEAIAQMNAPPKPKVRYAHIPTGTFISVDEDKVGPYDAQPNIYQRS